MGGSSLAAEVIRSIFEKKGYLKTYILDTTNPDTINSVIKKIKLKETLFIFSSKSGGTVEPNSQFKYFYSELKKITKNPQNHFIAITDEGTSLHQLAKKLSFRKIFINPSDIGGRFSALSYFGLVPAVICGCNINNMVERAIRVIDRIKKDDISYLTLGSFIATNYLNGKDKLTIILPEKLKQFGLWIEQLIAESTGKEGKGILPVINTEVLEPEYYDTDRMFVILEDKKSFNESFNKEIENLISANFPIMKISVNNEYDIADQFYIWEISTAIVGYFMKINPFDQPDVNSTKEITKKLLITNEIKLNPQKMIGNLELYYSNIELNNEIKNLDDLIWEILKETEEKHYYSICSYLEENKETKKLLKRLSLTLTTATNKTAIYSYGPRYLHSTGQLFKGGANNGLFIILTSKPKKDIKILGESYSFYKLLISQAKGDFLALTQKRRKVIMIHSKDSALKSMKLFLTKLSKITKEEEMPKALTTKKKNPASNPKSKKDTGYVVIDYPKHMETITSRHYTIRIGASNDARGVEVSIDNGPWQPARHSVGYWWYDWNDISTGNHEIIAKMNREDGSFIISKRRRCKAA